MERGAGVQAAGKGNADVLADREGLEDRGQRREGMR
jgi:hypothetical protein